MASTAHCRACNTVDNQHMLLNDERRDKDYLSEVNFTEVTGKTKKPKYKVTCLRLQSHQIKILRTFKHSNFTQCLLIHCIFIIDLHVL